jgi:hypothetical protein
MARTLKKEFETYERTREHLLATHKGEFVLIYNSDVIGCFGSEREAIDEGYRRLGHVPFLVKEICEFEEPLYVFVLARIMHVGSRVCHRHGRR